MYSHLHLKFRVVQQIKLKKELKQNLLHLNVDEKKGWRIDSKIMTITNMESCDPCSIRYGILAPHET